MKILRTLGILALTVGLVLGSSGSILAQGPPDELPSGGPHSPGKRGLFGTVASVAPDGDGYVIELETNQGTVDVTINGDPNTKYKTPRETKGWIIGVETFADTLLDGDVENIVDRRIAVLVQFTNESTADALRLMLIPSPSSAPTHAHRVGIVDEFNPGSDITIIDKDGESHTFTINGTVYHPEGTTAVDIVVGSPVTVVTTGDPKLGPEAKAIVLHEELPDWAQP